MILYILNLLDLLTTAIALDMGGVEMNPLANWLIGVHPMLFVFCKIVVVGALILLLVWKENWKALWFLFMLHVAVVANNIYIIFLLGGYLWQ